MNRFNSCLDSIFTTKQYQVQYDDITIARFRLLTQQDYYRLNSSRLKTFNNNPIFYIKQPIIEQSQIEPISTSSLYQLSIIITWWIFDQQITVNNLKMLNQKYLNIILESYNKIKYQYQHNYKAYFNNIKEYILLMQNKSNHKHLATILKSNIVIEKVCKHCRQYQNCNNKQILPKFLQVTKRVVRCAYDYINQRPYFINHNGGFEQQPLWFTNFTNYAINQIIQIQSNNKSNTNTT